MEKFSHLEIPIVHSLVVRFFTESNNISNSNFLKNEFLKGIVEKTTNQFESKCSPGIEFSFSDIGYNMQIEDVEAIFESLIDSDRKKKQGVVYTPDYIIDYLISESLKMSPKHPKDLTICDPACGSGGFLVGACGILLKQGIDVKHFIDNQIIGFDISEESVEFAKSHVLLYLLNRGYDVSDIEPQIFAMDTLLENPEQLWERIGNEEGFDIVATNPPYVKLQNLSTDYRKELRHKYKDFTTGNYSLAMLYFVACHRMINPLGVTAFITQNNVFSSNSATKIRQYAKETKCIRRVVNFSHHLIFDGILAYTCLIFQDNDLLKNTFEFKDMYKGINTSSLPFVGFSDIPYSSLGSKKWRLAENPHRLNISKIENTGVCLGELCEIKVGFATLRDKVFQSKMKRGKWFAKTLNGEDVEIESNLIKSAIKISEITDDLDLSENKRGIIFPYKQVDGFYRLINEDEIKSKSPRTFKHLFACKAELAKRDAGNRAKQEKYGAWYAWGRKQGIHSKGPKLLTKTFDKKPNFRMDPSDSLFSNGYAIMPQKPIKSGVEIPLITLQRILNSRFMHYYAKLTSFQISGDYQCYQKNFIESFGIPVLDTKAYKFIETCTDTELEHLLSKSYDISLKHIDEYFEY